ncbi:uncharacterized protein V2V93DRAFT_347112 [Kockiozyma suomiensis]|uniref:uncharacterized protein n=1 Tax=Kockiozyma suomiensis TaxID=1337062 RepID=UPI00334438A8
MRVFKLLIAACVSASAVAAWSFKDGSLTITEKAGTLQTESFSVSKPFSDPIPLPNTATARFRFSIESEESGTSKPHQAYLQISDPTTGLETSFPADVRDNGRARIDVEFKLIPKALLGPDKTLDCKIIIGSFGTEKPIIAYIGSIIPRLKGAAAAPSERFAAKPEIKHIFKPDPEYTSESLAIVFSAAICVLGLLLIGVWIYLGVTPITFGNPLYSLGFITTIIVIEFAFFQYYVGATIFKLIAQSAILAPIAFLSGTRALRDLRARRLSSGK